MTVLRKISKAIGAGIGAGVSAAWVANQAGGITTEEWGGIVGAVLVGFAFGFFAPKNQPA